MPLRSPCMDESKLDHHPIFHPQDGMRSYGKSMENLGNAMENLWNIYIYGKSMEILWTLYGTSMENKKFMKPKPSNWWPRSQRSHPACQDSASVWCKIRTRRAATACPFHLGLVGTWNQVLLGKDLVYRLDPVSGTLGSLVAWSDWRARERIEKHT